MIYIIRVIILKLWIFTYLWKILKFESTQNSRKLEKYIKYGEYSTCYNIL